MECMKVRKSVCRQCVLTRNVNSFITFRILLFRMKRFDTKKKKKEKKVFDHNALYLTVLYVSMNKKRM